MFGPIGPIPPNPSPLFTVTITPQSPISATSLFLEEASQREKGQRNGCRGWRRSRWRQRELARYRQGTGLVARERRERRRDETRVEITMAQRDSAAIHGISAAKAAVRLKHFATSSSVAARGHSALQ